MKEGLEKFVAEIAKANGYQYNIETGNGLRASIRIGFVHEDPLKSWFFDCYAHTMSGLLDKMRDEFIPACRNVGFKIPGDEVKLALCKHCAGELVKIRGRSPSDEKRIVCPTCQADMLYDIKQWLSHD